MKKTFFTFGDFRCFAYLKAAGQGFEVGFQFGRETIFVGNFIHKAEATKWWNLMNKEMKTFTTRFQATEDAPFAWYAKFFSHHLYNSYYNFLEQEFAKHQKTFAKAFAKDAKKYETFKKNWDGEALSFRRAN